jgi:hypothetical protein
MAPTLRRVRSGYGQEADYRSGRRSRNPASVVVPMHPGADRASVNGCQGLLPLVKVRPDCA